MHDHEYELPNALETFLPDEQNLLLVFVEERMPMMYIERDDS